MANIKIDQKNHSKEWALASQKGAVSLTRTDEKTDELKRIISSKEASTYFSKSASVAGYLKQWIPFTKSKNSEKDVLERVNNVTLPEVHSFLDKLDDEAIANMSIQKLLLLMMLAIALDLQESQHVSEQTLKFIRRLEEKRMKDMENAYTSVYKYLETAGGLGGAFAAPILTSAGFDPKAAQAYGGAFPALGGYMGNLGRKGIDMEGVRKQLATQMKQDQQEAQRELSRDEDKLKQMIDQLMQLKLQSFR